MNSASTKLVTPPELPTEPAGRALNDLRRTAITNGVTTAFVYNNRHLVTNINYTVPAGVGTTSNVSFEYDAAGNRTSRYNGVELRQYHYDQLSRMDYEDINFPGLDPTWRRISYQYNKAGQLARVTNPWNAQAAYTYDANGRTTDVRGTDVNGYATYSGVPNYALNLRYRAFGAVKGMTYGNNKTMTAAYDQRLRLKTWDVQGVLGWNYAYDKFRENSHRVTYAQNLYDATLNRSFEYDQVGRLWEAHSGNEADAHAAKIPFPPTPTARSRIPIVMISTAT